MMSAACVAVCDVFASCSGFLFDKTALPQAWKGWRIALFWAINLLAISANLAVNWIGFSALPLEGLSDDVHLNCSKGQEVCGSGTIRVCSILYLIFTVLVTICFPLHFLCAFFEFSQKRYNPAYHRLVESLLLLLESCGLPLLLFFVLFAFSLGGGLRKFFQQDSWEIYIFAVVNILCTFWKCFKLSRLGLCCCFCSGVVGATWPIQKRVRTLSGTVMHGVLEWMPTESYTKNWLVVCQWCCLSTLLVPIILIGLISDIFLIIILKTGVIF